MSQLVQQLVENFVVVAVALIALGLGWFSINYLGKRRQMLHQERMATLVKSLHYAGVGKEIFSKPTTASRDHALRGLRWLFGAAGLSAALYASTWMEPSFDPAAPTRAALAGIIPFLIGIAHLLFSFFTRSKPTPDLFSAASRNRQRRYIPTRTLYR
jgi:hypothetical protein